MRTETKANIILGSIATVMVLIVGFLFVVGINEAFGESEPYGEPYIASYSYCKTMSYGAKGSSWCSQYATGHEKRQKVHIKGLFFDGESSKLVD
jgi:hypothetical protein